jgi:hypothetical protein
MTKRKKYTSEFKLARSGTADGERGEALHSSAARCAAQSCSIVLRLLISVEQPCERKND